MILTYGIYLMHLRSKALGGWYGSWWICHHLIHVGTETLRLEFILYNLKLDFLISHAC